MLLYAQDEIGYSPDAVITEVAQRIGIAGLDVRNVHRILHAAHQTRGQIQRAGLHQYQLHAARWYEFYEHLQGRARHRTKGVTPMVCSRSKRSSASAPAAGLRRSRSTTTSTRPHPDQGAERSWRNIAAGQGKDVQEMPSLVSASRRSENRLPSLRPGRSGHRQVHRTRRLQGRRRRPSPGARARLDY